MTEFTYAVTLRDSRNQKSVLQFDLGDFSTGTPGGDFDAALNAAGQIAGALAAVTDANIAKEFLGHSYNEDNQLPASADVTDELVVACHLAPPTQAEKLHNLRIPAPDASVWQTDGITADLSVAALIQYVQQIAQHAFVSDGEQVDVSTGSNGMKYGYWRSRARKAS